MLALLAMIYPFTWQSVFLPLLPTKLLAYVCAPYPYLIGIRRHQLGEVNKQPVGDVVLVDLDSGDRELPLSEYFVCTTDDYIEVLH